MRAAQPREDAPGAAPGAHRAPGPAAEAGAESEAQAAAGAPAQLPLPAPADAPDGEQPGRPRGRTRTSDAANFPGAPASSATPAAPAGPADQAEPADPADPADPATTAAEPAVPPLHPEDRRRLLAGEHHDPHAHLGAHLLPDGAGVLFRTLRPFAAAVTVTVAIASAEAAPADAAPAPAEAAADGTAGGEVRGRLESEGDGFFAAVLPLTELPPPDAYQLHVRYGELTDAEEDADEIRTADPHRFLPALGELDLHLIGEGRHEELWRALGAHTMRHQGVHGTRFTVWAPNALGVRIAGDFNRWNGTAFPMRSLGASGVWELFVPGLGDGALYKYEITGPDGTRTLRADPMARRTEAPPATASIVHTSTHEWHDADWLAARAEAAPHSAPLTVYEVHLPSWRPGLGYRELADQLPAYVRDLGFTHVELMPCAEHPYGGSWGYQITGFYAPTARLGSPDDFKHLIDALHQAGIGVLMDWVPAHFPKDDWALARFDGTALYEHADPARAEHPDWGTLEFDLGRREVRNFLVANAVYWCEEFHIDGLRVDAVASMLYLDYSREHGAWTPNRLGGREDLDAVAMLQEMNATVYRRCPGVLTAAEESTAWNGVTRATHHTGENGFGGLGFGFKWNMGWMHDSLTYLGRDPVHRRHHHNELTFSMVYAYTENYILPISHDEVVHGKRSLVAKTPGDWWQQRANHRAYLGFMWAHPGKQLLFMGQEFAQGAEWSHEHGPDWWLLDPAYPAEPDHRGVRDLVRDLNTVYTRTPALWQLDTVPAGFAWIDADAADDNVFAFLRYAAAGSPLISVTNFSPVVRSSYRLGVPQPGVSWHEVLNTDAEQYGGSGVRNTEPLLAEAQPAHGRPASITPVLPPLATVFFEVSLPSGP